MKVSFIQPRTELQPYIESFWVFESLLIPKNIGQFFCHAGWPIPRWSVLQSLQIHFHSPGAVKGSPKERYPSLPAPILHPTAKRFGEKRERTPRSRRADLYGRTRWRQSVPDPSIRSRPAASANARKSRSRVRRGTPPSMQLWAISAAPRRALRRFASTFARKPPALCQ